MNPTPNHFPKIAILGMGAVTITIARALTKNKIPFTILARDEFRKKELQDAPVLFRFKNENLDSLHFSENTFTLKETKDKFDYIFLGAKSSNLSESIQNSASLLSSDGKFILIQNGIPEESLSIPTNQMIGGVVGWNTQKLPDGIYFQSNIGTLVLGGVDGTVPELFWEKALSPYIPVVRTDNLIGYRWHKLGINSVINGVSASCQLTLGKLMLNVYGRKVSMKVLGEIRSVMDKLEIKEEVVPGSVSVQKLGDGKGALPVAIRHLILIILGIKYYKIRTSMVQDLDQGRKTEIQDLNGLVVQHAKALGLPCSTNESILKRVKELEEGKTKPDLLFLKNLVS